MERPKVGLLAFGDPRDEVYERAPEVWRQVVGIYDNVARILEEKCGFEVLRAKEVVRSKKSAFESAAELIWRGAECLILLIPAWTFPVLPLYSAKKAKECNIPVLIYGDYMLSGLLATSGALKQVGIMHKFVWGKLTDEKIVREINSFVRAASTALRLRGLTYGVFGGRSLGIYTATADLAQWQKTFGIDIEHVDQMEIVREAEKVSRERVEKFMSWLEENCGLIEIKEPILTREKLERQVRCYLALKDLTKKKNFDFVGIKCQPELSDGYVTQCLSAAFMNDPYDAEGPKEPIVCACEVDHDGALTMQILKLISGGKPVLFMDLLFLDYENRTFICGNCGGMATWFAKRSDDPKVNLREVHLRPQVQGKAGGATTQYVAASAETATLARLFRKEGEYYMVVMKGKFINMPRETLKEKSIWPWPHVFVKVDRDPFEILEEYGANHIHAVVGDYVNELVDFCQITRIKCKT